MGIFYKLKMSFNNNVLNTDIRHFHIRGDPPPPMGHTVLVTLQLAIRIW